MSQLKGLWGGRALAVRRVGAAALGLASLGPAGSGAPGDAGQRAKVERLLSGSAEDRPLALAFIGENRLLAVTLHAVRLFKVQGAPAPLADLAWPDPLHPVRAPAALLSVDAAAATAWVLTNGAEKACLVAVDGDHLSVRAQADALPWPGSPQGLRYREGTDWIEGSVEGLGAGPFLTLLHVDRGLGVAPDGRLLDGEAPERGGGSPMTVGPTLAPLWPGAVAASTARPPGSGDAILVLERGDAGLHETRALPVEGAIRAIAGRRTPEGAVLAFSTDTSEGYELWRLRLEGPR